MENNGVDRLIHTSASKYGAENVTSVYDKEGNFLGKEDLDKIMRPGSAGKQSEMQWSGFGYQQDQPYSEEHKEVSLVTQADKTVFSGVQNLMFDYKGEKVSGKNLVERKDSLRTKLSNIEEAGLDDELGWNGVKQEIDKDKTWEFLRSLPLDLNGQSQIFRLFPYP
jgi:hypothetical protein